MNALREACKVTNDEKIMNIIHRILNIWQQRSVYHKEFINELRELLCGEKIESEVISKIIADFNLNDMINQINNAVKVEQSTRAKYQNLINCKLDFANSDLLNKLKDKSYGEQCSKELDDATKCLEAAKVAIEKEIATRKALITMLEKNKIYYDIQMKESKAIAETFNNCEVRLRQVQSKLNNFSGYNFSSLNKPPEINASQLSSVLNFFQQTNNEQVSSLDKRLTSLMSGTGQFPLNPGIYVGAGSNENFNKNLSARDVNQIESVITARSFGNENPVENFEPADMDLGDSEDEDRHAIDSVKKSSLLPPLSSFIGTPDIAGTYCFIPPPPPPPMPPPSFKEFLGSSSIDSNDLDTFRAPQPPQPASPITPLSLSNIIPNIPNHMVDVNNFQLGDSIQSLSPSNRHGHHNQHHHHNRNSGSSSSSSSASSPYLHQHHNQSPSSSSSINHNHNNRYSQNNRHSQNYSNNRQQMNMNNRWKNGGGTAGGWKRY
ncbi:RNA polymerase II-binding domain containing protein [Euroglyphus maynei]|uniref:RNA polymerase II-binding domain containing protein n=1 Tax=Euroglyphus maynei TaxID=6958 RepID=A0A1Y3BSE2_EURMA|nr:RNA polymerase II-binding domain containing protein [Euroglyphus maynei]